MDQSTTTKGDGYDPFPRGKYPVGVKTESWVNEEKGRTLPVEIWYPATSHYAGMDSDPEHQDQFVPTWSTETSPSLVTQAAVRDAEQEAGTFPLVFYFHGWGGFRQQSTYLATHLTSHGYIVVAPDVPSSTFEDIDRFLTSQEPIGRPEDLNAHWIQIAQNRKIDVPFLIDAAATRLDVTSERVGITGASYGGWTSLVAPALDRRVAAIGPMCPGGGSSPIDDGILGAQMDWQWLNPVPTMMLAADRDCLLPLYGVLELFRKVPSADRRLVILANADHNHFVDNVEIGHPWLGEFVERVAKVFPDGPGNWRVSAETVSDLDDLCDGALAHVAWRGLITAHMDAHIRQLPEAGEFLSGDLETDLANQGVTANIVYSSVEVDGA